MYLASLTIKGFRRIQQAELTFKSGLNVIVGENNIGKTAIVDGLRALLSTVEDGSLRLDESDLHINEKGERASDISFSYLFKQLSLSEEADFAAALKPGSEANTYDAHLHVMYTPTSGGRLRPKRWCGDHEDNVISMEMQEDLRAIYLPPLRDPALGLRPSRASQLARLLARLASEEERKEITEATRQFEKSLEDMNPVANTQKAIEKQHGDMLGDELKQNLSVGLTPPDFQRIAARLQLEVDDFDVEQNGLGYNNLLYMAVVLSELETNPDCSYKALIIEEPEAHLHPQLQGTLMKFLQGKETPPKDTLPVQIFVTSHSPNVTSIANLDSICCIHRASDGVKAFTPRDVTFDHQSKKDKLQRYLDVTRAELFFARRIVLVEGTAELFLIDALARKSGYDLKKKAVSILSVEGLNFDCFLPLFGSDGMGIKVAIVTDSDPPKDSYPLSTDSPSLSATAATLAAATSDNVKAFFAKKTLEYDLALHTSNQNHMLNALKQIHPDIGKALVEKVANAGSNEAPKVIFNGLFARETGANIQKGRYAQALAAVILEDKCQFECPPYISEALSFVAGA